MKCVWTWKNNAIHNTFSYLLELYFQHIDIIRLMWYNNSKIVYTIIRKELLYYADTERGLSELSDGLER